MIASINPATGEIVRTFEAATAAEIEAILARADAGQSLTRDAIPIRAVIEEACKQARQLDRRREIIEDVDDLTVIGDRDALKQVLLILLDNAIKYTTEEITVSAEAAGKQVVIRVHDNGSGISPEKLEHVFDRFYRGKPNPNVQGFGLGLPIAKALIEGQGGKIEIQSKSSQGTTVKISLNSTKENKSFPRGNPISNL